MCRDDPSANPDAGLNHRPIKPSTLSLKPCTLNPKLDEPFLTLSPKLTL